MGALIERVRELSRRPVLVPVDGALPVSVSDEARLADWDGDVCLPCFYCGCQTDKANYTRDHIVPQSRGGLDAQWNVVPCCASCNSSKKDSTASEWVRWRLWNRLRGGWIPAEAKAHVARVRDHVATAEGYHAYVMREVRVIGLEDSQERIKRRLDDGWKRIDQAIAQGNDVTAWETFWIDLLREYETICDELSGQATEVRI